MDSYMRIVNNLIQNVIAHSHAGKIKIALSKQENHMELLLADNGVGIEKEDLKHIFERLYKCVLSPRRASVPASHPDWLTLSSDTLPSVAARR